MSSPENRVVFLSVPESLRGQIETGSGRNLQEDEDDDEAFFIDPAIPLPVELIPGTETLNPEELSWEMILSGMLRVITDYPAGNTAKGSGDTPAFMPQAPWIDYYRRFVVTVKPDILKEFTGAAILKAENGDFDMALEILTILTGLFPKATEPVLNRALILGAKAAALAKAGQEAEAEKEYLRAETAYEEILAREPVFPNGLFNAGFFFMERRNFDKARECFSAYTDLTEDPEKKEKAEAVLREIKERGLDDAIFREAYDFIRIGEEQRGLLKIKEFLECHPKTWNGWFLLGWGLRRLGRWEDGADSLRKAIELGGRTCDTRNELAICLMEQGDLTGARKELERALREDPENIKIISNLGVLALKNGDDAEAAGFFRTVLELEPEDTVAREYLAQWEEA
jgi:tetratricopeptide (TPR) repeat protein